MEGAAAAVGSFSAGTVVLEDGVAGVGAGEPGPAGPVGTPADFGTGSGLKDGSELSIASLRSA